MCVWKLNKMAIAQERAGRRDCSLESVCRAREGEVPDFLRKGSRILAILKYTVPKQQNEEKTQPNKQKELDVIAAAKHFLT